MREQDESSPSPIELNEPVESNKPIPVAIVRRRRFSFAWFVPIAAIVVVSYMVWSQVTQHRGEMITIQFHDASGLKPESHIIHRGVTIGIVRELTLNDDLSGVEAHCELIPGAEQLAVDGTQFWVVKAEVSLRRIAGLETLLGPNYIALRPGAMDGPMQREFVALDESPIADRAMDGSLRLVLRSDRLGTLSPGNPVFYREIRVGTIREAHLTSDSTSVMIAIDIDPRYTPLVRENTMFWRSGGVGVDFGLFRGLSVQADSLEALMSSSISFATPEKKPGDVVIAGTEFELADSADEDWVKWSPRIEVGE